jgi:orotate phosphoribosyltransferase
MKNKQRLIEILLERSVQFGDFTLSSGKKTDFYVDGKMTTLTPEASWAIATLIIERLDPEISAVGGPGYGAAPIVGAVVPVSYAMNRKVNGFLIRDSVKKYGTRRWIEGKENIPDGSTVCVVEDTCTTGASILSAISKIEHEGLRVGQVITIVDRQEGGKERIEKAGYKLEVLVSKEDLVLAGMNEKK